jgi:hypothetical protein
MNKLGGATRSCLCEVCGFYKRGPQSACCSVHRDSESGSSTADHEHVEFAIQRTKFRGAVCHQRKLLLHEDTTSCIRHGACAKRRCLPSIFIPYIQGAAVEHLDEAAFYFGQPGQAGGGFSLGMSAVR